MKHPNLEKLGCLNKRLESAHLKFERERKDKGASPGPPPPPEELQQVMGWTAPGTLTKKRNKR